MSPWRSGLCALAISLFLPLLSLPARGDGDGPRSPAEERQLAREGRKRFSEGQYRQAAALLERLTSRYPTSPEGTESLVLLGRARIQLGENDQAGPPLKGAIQRLGKSSEGIEARVWLARSYLGGRKPSEALLLSDEILNLTREKSTVSGVHADAFFQALLLRAQAQAELKQLDDAVETYATFASEFKKRQSTLPSRATLLAESLWLKARLKVRECGTLPGAGPADEGQVRQLIQRQSACLQEALLILKEQLAGAETTWNPLSVSELKTGYSELSQACQAPPPPPGNRTRAELTLYWAEFRPILQRDCQKEFGKGSDLLRSLSAQLSPRAQRELVPLDSLLKELKK